MVPAADSSSEIISIATETFHSNVNLSNLALLLHIGNRHGEEDLNLSSSLRERFIHVATSEFLRYSQGSILFNIQ